MMDATVYDIKSRSLLFRAPGVSQVKAHSTIVNLSEELRADCKTGFDRASEDLVKNLQVQLTEFRLKVKSMPQAYAVEHKPGYNASSSLNGWLTVLVVALGGLALWRTRKRSA